MTYPQQPTIDYLAMSEEEIAAAWENYANELDAYNEAMRIERKRFARANYYEGLAAAKRAIATTEATEPRITMQSLKLRYGHYTEQRKKKCADKGYKVTHKWHWDNYAGYLNDLRRYFPKQYGLTLCQEAQNDFTTDRYWDVATDREEAIKSYRALIKGYQSTYGLTRSEVKRFMIV